MNVGLCVVLLAASVTGWAAPAPASDRAAEQLLSQAIVAAGGQSALSAAPVLAWTGTARIYSDKKIIDISVDTVVEPPVRARSISWLTEVGRSTERTLAIDESGGTLIRGGVRTAMPQPMFDHERQQYAIYELLRLTPLRRADVTLIFLPNDRSGRRGVQVRRPNLPSANMWFDKDARLAMVETTVTDPGAGGSIREEVVFFGQIEDKGVHWPKLIKITCNGKPYFDLTLTSFSTRTRFE